MFDAIKKLAGKALDTGLAYLRHCAAIEQILKSPTQEIGIQALRDYVHSIDTDVDFQLFKGAVLQQCQLAQQAQANADNAWGSSFEDRLAYRVAHINAGEPTGGAAARQRLAALQAMYQLADIFRSEAKPAELPAAVDPRNLAR